MLIPKLSFILFHLHFASSTKKVSQVFTFGFKTQIGNKNLNTEISIFFMEEKDKGEMTLCTVCLVTVVSDIFFTGEI